jgi:hypothetical protein
VVSIFVKVSLAHNRVEKEANKGPGQIVEDHNHKKGVAIVNAKISKP